MAGFVIAASTEVLAARYLSLFLMLAGVYGSYNVALAWISSTVCWLIHLLSCSYSRSEVGTLTRNPC
jgi:hypothetical protein